MSSVFGNRIKVSVFGQSHSKGIGVTVDGIPAGEKIDFDELQRFLDRINFLPQEKKGIDLNFYLAL